MRVLLILLAFMGAAHAQTSGGIAQSGHFQHLANGSQSSDVVRNSVFTQKLADQCADTRHFNCRTLVAPPAETQRRLPWLQRRQ